MKNKYFLIKETENEKAILNFFNKNEKRLSGMTIGDVAKEAHVSEASISRCIKRLGFDNFIVFKNQIKNKEKNTLKVSNIAHELINFIKEIDFQITDEMIENIAKIFESASMIMITSNGKSKALAQEFSWDLNSQGINSNMNITQHDLHYFYKPGNILVAITMSGKNEILKKYCDQAKIKKIPVVIFTFGESKGWEGNFDLVIKIKKFQMPHELTNYIDVGISAAFKMITFKLVKKINEIKKRKNRA